MYRILIYILILVSTLVKAQTTISGKIVDKKELPIQNANVFIEGTYDGAISNNLGEFSFETSSKGSQTLKITALMYEDFSVQISTENFQNKTIHLIRDINTIETVVIAAGTFKAGDNSKMNALKPLDIVTTAGAVGDIVGALQTLPGAQINAESGRLFVRGGDSDETQTFIDGLRVAQPYGVTPNNLPTRGRFSPFLFNGITFSTGGYSAEFGDALSSILLMNTDNELQQNKTDIGIMSVGLNLGKAKKWKTNSFSFNSTYINLQPYQWIVPQRVNWNKAYQGGSGESVFKQNFNKGIFKFYSAFDFTTFDLNQFNINSNLEDRVKNNNTNLYSNASLKYNFDNNWILNSGVSFGYSVNNMDINSFKLLSNERATHLKVKIHRKFNRHITLMMGSEFFNTNFDETYSSISNFKSGYNLNQGAAFTELDVLFTEKFAAKIGGRWLRNSLLNENKLEPRLSFAYKIFKKSQFSLAYGDFHQAPKQEYLKYNTNFDLEKTQHYILNYMYNSDKRTLRAELYYKKYHDLIKYNTPTPLYYSNFNNNGFGYAKGFDLFWRDSKTLKNFDYWLTYTFIDTKRDFRNYTKEVMPSFVAHHTFSIVTKYWMEDWKSQLSVSNSFATGRPYNNPNNTHFMSEKTKAFNNLSVSWAYLITQQKILFFSVTNVLGRDNIFGYEYASTRNAAGLYPERAITQPASRFFFIGFFWTISNDKKSNQLDNL